MAIYISEKLKQYRKAHDLTQEQIAEIFNVSTQSVSRWETGATYPDIEILPSIAAYYKITVDELLGVDKIKDKERIEQITNEVTDKFKNGKISETIEILRDAVREFPHEYSLQNMLALALSQPAELDKEKAENNLLEAIAIRERVLENSTDDAARNNALFGLSQNYKKIGDIEKAVKTAKKLSSASGSSNVVLTTIYEGNELHEHLKRDILIYSQYLANDIEKLANSMYKYGSTERIELLNKAISIFNLIFENGDYGFNNFFLIWINYQLAGNYCKINDRDNALKCLEKAVRYAIESDTTDLKYYTSLAVKGAENNRVLVKSYRYNECYELLHGLGLTPGEFESISAEERFKTIVSTLEQYAKSEYLKK
jgi:Predicted transcriptional regulators